MGSITAVAVWDHDPEPRELLARRLERGWMSTPSRLKGGDRVLGYAGCAVTGVPHRGTGGLGDKSAASSIVRPPSSSSHG